MDEVTSPKRQDPSPRPLRQLLFTRCQLEFLERQQVIEPSVHADDDFADDVKRLSVVGVDDHVARGSNGQSLCRFCVIHHELGEETVSFGQCSFKFGAGRSIVLLATSICLSAAVPIPAISSESSKTSVRRACKTMECASSPTPSAPSR